MQVLKTELYLHHNLNFDYYYHYYYNNQMTIDLSSYLLITCQIVNA